jgi:hypothetical protein
MPDYLLQKIEESDESAVSELTKNEMTEKGQAWAVHLSLYPVVQRVLNPPFINPHLPKMYRINREFGPYLQEEEIPALVKLEINEYTRRAKREKIPKAPRLSSSVSFEDVETAIREGERAKAAALLNGFLEQKGGSELARKLLLLGSGYLDDSLGHSVSCTAFILLEMMERSDQDPWPALATLADYFCKGRFHTTPALRGTGALPPEKTLHHHLLSATSGRGIVNLHHTITRYSVERVRHLLSEKEYSHMVACWIEFLGAKRAEPPSLVSTEEAVRDYTHFYQVFSKGEEKPVLASLAGRISSEEGRRQLGRYLIKGVCDLYQGNYDPHYLTGLGSLLWAVNDYWNQPLVALNALRQYVNYFSVHMIY